MQTCPRCGFHNMNDAQRCLRCSSILSAAAIAPDPLAAPGREHFEDPLAPRRGARLLNILWRVAGPLGRLAHRVRGALAEPLPAHIEHRNIWLSGTLSILPGLGQLYNGQRKKALEFLLLEAAILALAAVTFRHPLSNLILLAALGVLILGWHDAVMTAKWINRHFMTWQRGVAFYCAWIFYVSVACLAFQFFGRHALLRFLYVQDDLVRPHLRRGEHIAVDVLSYLRRDPAVGDIVFFDPDPVTLENTQMSDRAIEWLEKNADLVKRPGGYLTIYAANAATKQNMVIVDPRGMIERVVAGPGERFERREGRFWRNGRLLTPPEEPLVQDQLPASFDLRAPPGHYVILFSYTGRDIDPVSLQGGIMTTAPRLNDEGWVARGWAEACVVPRERIQGRVWLVYQPPQARRLVR